MINKRQREKIDTIIGKLDNLSRDRLQKTALLHIAAARSELTKISYLDRTNDQDSHTAKAGDANHGGDRLDS
jgi:hypothetical protein